MALNLQWDMYSKGSDSQFVEAQRFWTINSMDDNSTPLNLYPAKDQINALADTGAHKDHVYLRNALEGIPLLTMDNFSHWRNRLEKLLTLQGLTDSLMKPKAFLPVNKTINSCR
ncbi:hypothetical protein PSTG_15000 [Puccinia striiformis f. sp. tritici PST-78]|uniref:Uncharacterized protein n=1 Tax=Puccinia striiformis f. sp. tritici PST-78 TaxID=1165861 RepID=A0A0L0UXY5_9BASI|nr:hypothetical protein PSTG_15000 [Puccinia striiformis f. sp. tritici PST-78]